MNALRYHSRESERRTAMLFYLFLDREVSNLNNEVGPVWSYVLRITPDTSDNTAHTVDDLFVPQTLRWMRVCDLVCAVGRGRGVATGGPG